MTRTNHQIELTGKTGPALIWADHTAKDYFFTNTKGREITAHLHKTDTQAAAKAYALRQAGLRAHITEDSTYTLSKWRQAVKLHLTTEGYYEWAINQLNNP